MNELAVVTSSGEADVAFDQGEEGVVFADTNVLTRMELSSTLTHEDIAGQNDFATELLHAKSLGMRLATVFGTTYAFLVSHSGVFRLGLLLNGFDLDLAELLTVTVLLLVALAALLFENDHFVALQVRKYFEGDFSPTYVRCTYLYFTILVKQENFGGLEGLTFGIGQAVHEDLLIFCHFELLTLNVYNRVHRY